MWPFRSRAVNPAEQMYPGASGAAVLMSTWGDPNAERIPATFQGYADGGMAGNSSVFSLIMNRLLLFSEAEFKFQSLADKKLFGNTDLAVLEEPWPNGTTADLLARMEIDVSLAGNAYVRAIPEAGRLERLRPDRVTIVSELLPDQNGRPYRQVIGYGYDRRGDGADLEFYDVSEVAHYAPIPDAIAEFRGMSWLTPVVREIHSDSALTDYKVAYLNHAGTPNLMIKYGEKVKPETITAIEDRIDAKYRGPANAGKTIVVDAGADLTIVGSTLKDMDFSLVQGAGETRLASAAGVPPIIAGFKEGLASATYSNYSLAMRRFADLTARPWWRGACGALASIVQAPTGARLWFDVTSIAALQAGELDAASVMTANAATAHTLLAAGYAPDTVMPAVLAGDLSLLTHTGAIPTSVYKPINGASPNGNNTPALNGAN